MEGFICPGCGEEIYLEELVEGSCPLCQKSCSPGRNIPSRDALQSPEERERWLISLRAADRLKAAGLTSSGASDAASNLLAGVDPSSLKREERIVKRFRWRCSTGLRDYLGFKYCTFCGRRHLLVGDKVLEGVMEIETDEAGVMVDANVHWVCRGCSSRTPRSALGADVPPPL